jgi:hypothetical protein
MHVSSYMDTYVYKYINTYIHTLGNGGGFVFDNITLSNRFIVLFCMAIIDASLSKSFSFFGWKIRLSWSLLW